MYVVKNAGPFLEICGNYYHFQLLSHTFFGLCLLVFKSDIPRVTYIDMLCKNSGTQQYITLSDTFYIFRSTSESRPNSIEGKNVRPYVRPSTKSFFNLNEIWYIGRGR